MDEREPSVLEYAIVLIAALVASVLVLLGRKVVPEEANDPN